MNLVNSLRQRKTDWTFETFEGLMAVMDGVPLFTRNALRISSSVPVNHHWLHIQSAEMLTEFRLQCGRDDDISLFDTESLGNQSEVSQHPTPRRQVFPLSQHGPNTIRHLPSHVDSTTCTN